jgi:nitrous oxide reductase accessory protein NosL
MKHLQSLLALCLLGMLIAGISFAATAVEKPANCQVCGMDRYTFASSRTVITYSDKSVVGTCSINCAHNDVASKKTLKIVLLQVADHDTRKLIDAKKAFWVIGGKEPGVMTGTAKWAFADRKRAEAFVGSQGGQLAGFEAVWKAAGH